MGSKMSNTVQYELAAYSLVETWRFDSLEDAKEELEHLQSLADSDTIYAITKLTKQEQETK